MPMEKSLLFGLWNELSRNISFTKDLSFAYLNSVECKSLDVDQREVELKKAGTHCHDTLETILRTLLSSDNHNNEDLLMDFSKNNNQIQRYRSGPSHSRNSYYNGSPPRQLQPFTIRSPSTEMKISSRSSSCYEVSLTQSPENNEHQRRSNSIEMQFLHYLNNKESERLRNQSQSRIRSNQSLIISHTDSQHYNRPLSTMRGQRRSEQQNNFPPEPFDEYLSQPINQLRSRSKIRRSKSRDQSPSKYQNRRSKSHDRSPSKHQNRRSKSYDQSSTKHQNRRSKSHDQYLRKRQNRSSSQSRDNVDRDSNKNKHPLPSKYKNQNIRSSSNDKRISSKSRSPASPRRRRYPKSRSRSPPYRRRLRSPSPRRSTRRRSNQKPKKSNGQNTCGVQCKKSKTNQTTGSRENHQCQQQQTPSEINNSNTTPIIPPVTVNLPPIRPFFPHPVPPRMLYYSRPPLPPPPPHFRNRVGLYPPRPYMGPPFM